MNTWLKSLGALLALRLTGTEFTLIALLGLFLLIGIVMKNAILMIDFAIDTERRNARYPRAAIFEAAQMRLRPILMTYFAALLGALPLVLASGEGVELRRPLGLAIVGGLANIAGGDGSTQDKLKAAAPPVTAAAPFEVSRSTASRPSSSPSESWTSSAWATKTAAIVR
jgi:hypothetical protein